MCMTSGLFTTEDSILAVFTKYPHLKTQSTDFSSRYSYSYNLVLPFLCHTSYTRHVLCLDSLVPVFLASLLVWCLSLHMKEHSLEQNVWGFFHRHITRIPEWLLGS